MDWPGWLIALGVWTVVGFGLWYLHRLITRGLVILLAVMVVAPAFADGPYQEPKKKPKAKVMAQPKPTPSPSPSPAPYDGSADFTAPTEAFEAPAPTPTPEPEPSPTPVPCGTEAGAEKSCPASVSIVAGASAAVSAGEGGIKPLVLIAFDGPIAKTRYSPRLIAGVDLGAGKGEAVNLSDPATFRTLTFRVSVVQPISGLFVAPYFGGGFATRVESDPEPLDRAARWWSAGLRIAGSRGWLEVGAGLDDRLGDGYQPTAHARGALLLGDRAGINAWLIGEAILGLRIGYAGTEGRVDVVTIGIGAGR